MLFKKFRFCFTHLNSPPFAHLLLLEAGGSNVKERGNTMLTWIKSEFGLSGRDVLKGIWETAALVWLCTGIYFLCTALV
jgi:hypothetical protein